MSFLLFSTLTVLLGIAGLGILLFVIQRLRVQHREVEVGSTLFWQAALKETRARVFVKQFRHWPAWLLLFAIASLLWMLLSQPTRDSGDQRQHVILIDGAVGSATEYEQSIEAATTLARRLPPSSRTIVRAGATIETLLAPGESIELLPIRAEEASDSTAENVHWSVAQFANQATEETPLSLYLIGHDSLEQSVADAVDTSVSLIGVPFEDEGDAKANVPKLTALGFCDSSSGDWGKLDVSICFEFESQLLNEDVDVLINDTQVSDRLQILGANEFLVPDVNAAGGVLKVQVDGQELGQLTLPLRSKIRVGLDSGLPPALRQLFESAPGIELVDDNAEVRVGFSAEDDFRLSRGNGSAFSVTLDSESEDIYGLVSRLAIDQIDATELATQASKTISIDGQIGERRKVEVWASLFGSGFNFVESRACPLFVLRSVEWLANRPAEVPWVGEGEVLPAAAPEFARVLNEQTTTIDGRELEATQFARVNQTVVDLSEVEGTSWLSGIGPFTLLGMLAATLLTLEWILFQRGRMP